MKVPTLGGKNKKTEELRAIFQMAFWDISGVAHHHSTKMWVMSLQGSFRPSGPAWGAGADPPSPSPVGASRAQGTSSLDFRAALAVWESWRLAGFLLSCEVFPDKSLFTEIPEQQGTSQNTNLDMEILGICAKMLSTPALALSAPFLPHPRFRFLLCICCGFLHTESFWCVSSKVLLKSS